MGGMGGAAACLAAESAEQPLGGGRSCGVVAQELPEPGFGTPRGAIGRTMAGPGAGVALAPAKARGLVGIRRRMTWPGVGWP